MPLGAPYCSFVPLLGELCASVETRSSLGGQSAGCWRSAWAGRRSSCSRLSPRRPRSRCCSGSPGAAPDKPILYPSQRTPSLNLIVSVRKLLSYHVGSDSFSPLNTDSVVHRERVILRARLLLLSRPAQNKRFAAGSARLGDALGSGGRSSPGSP